jgi:photosystem II stability/assembly factor-like uncharacterized protein
VEVPVIRSWAVVLSLVGCGSLLAGENVWTTNGPPGVVTALAVDPNGSWLLAGVGVEGRSVGYRSEDQGQTWVVIGEAPPTSSILGFAVDPDRAETVFAAATISAGTFSTATLFLSPDAGASWSNVTTLFATEMHALAHDANTLFAAGRWCRCFQAPCFIYSTCGPAVLRSADSGATWTYLPFGLAGSRVAVLAIDRSDPARIYAGGDGGLFVSDDNGDHWAASVSGMEGCSSVTAIATDPRNAGVVFAATTWRNTQPYACGAVFRSADSGRTWAPMSLRGRDVTSLAIDPRTFNVLYVGVATSNPVDPEVGVFRSTDGGSTWGRFGAGLPNSGVRGLVIEPSGRILHAATDQGVFDYEIVPGARPPVVPGWDRGETRSVPSRP